jgi:hypothetical protein
MLCEKMGAFRGMVQKLLASPEYRKMGLVKRIKKNCRQRLRT